MHAVSKIRSVRASNKTVRHLTDLVGAVLGISLILVVVFLIFDGHAVVNSWRVSREADRVARLIPNAEDVLKIQSPSGVVGSTAHYDRGSNLLELLGCGPDVVCPTSGRGTLVLVPNGQENKVMNSLLELSGYSGASDCSVFDTDSSSCYAFPANSKFQVHIAMSMADPFHHGAPAQDEISSPQVWRYVTIVVTLTN